MAAGAISLGHVATLTDQLAVACSRCDRAGRVSTARLLAEHGPNMPMTDLALDQRVRDAVRGWDALEQAHDRAARHYDWDAARAVTQRLEAHARALKQDKQLEGALRARGAEFGVEKGSRLERVAQAPEVSERLLRQVGLEQPRGRDFGPSLGM